MNKYQWFLTSPVAYMAPSSDHLAKPPHLHSTCQQRCSKYAFWLFKISNQDITVTCTKTKKRDTEKSDHNRDTAVHVNAVSDCKRGFWGFLHSWHNHSNLQTTEAHSHMISQHQWEHLVSCIQILHSLCRYLFIMSSRRAHLYYSLFNTCGPDGSQGTEEQSWGWGAGPLVMEESSAEVPLFDILPHVCLLRGGGFSAFFAPQASASRWVIHP